MNRDSRTMDTFYEILQEAKELRDDLDSCINEAVRNFIRNNKEMILQTAFIGFSDRLVDLSRNLGKAIEDLEEESEERIKEARAAIENHNEHYPDDKFDSYDEMSGLLDYLYGRIEMAQTYPEQIALGCENFDEVLERLNFRPYDMMMDCLDESIKIIQDETGFW